MKTWILRLVILLLVSAGASFLTVMAHHHLTKQQMPSMNLIRAQELSLDLWMRRLAAAIDRRDDALAREIAEPFAEQGFDFVLLNGQGEPLYQTGDFSAHVEACREAVRRGAAPGWNTLLRFDKNRELVLGTPRSHVGAPLYLGFFSTNEPPRDFKNIRALSYVIGLVVGLTILMAFIYVTDRPTRKVRQALQRITQGDYSTRLHPEKASRADSLSRLIEDFNDMAESLAKSFERQQMLISEISHEVRMPLSRMVLAAEMASTSDQTRARALLKRICEESQRMNRILEQVATLSRASARDLQLQQIDLRASCEHVIETVGFEAERYDKTLTPRFDAEPTILGNQEYVHSIIENLLMNAVKYSHRGTDIELRLSASQNGGPPFAQVEIQDQGPGIPENDLQHVFEPYYRSTATAHSKGTGLGLTIARHLTLLHGGEIKLENCPDSGLRVVVRLPITQ